MFVTLGKDVDGAVEGEKYAVLRYLAEGQNFTCLRRAMLGSTGMCPLFSTLQGIEPAQAGHPPPREAQSEGTDPGTNNSHTSLSSNMQNTSCGHGAQVGTEHCLARQTRKCSPVSEADLMHAFGGLWSQSPRQAAYAHQKCLQVPVLLRPAGTPGVFFKAEVIINVCSNSWAQIKWNKGTSSEQ